MGSGSSTEEKKVDSNGNINNNLVLEGPVSLANTELIIMIGIICFIKVVEVIYLAFRTYQRGLKKKYSASNRSTGA